jgi:hypothetical protein
MEELMTKRTITIAALVGLLLIGGLLTLLATSEVQQVGTAAGIRYTLAHGGLHGYSFVTLPTGFRFEQRSWFGLGRPNLEVTVENGRLLVDQIDCGPIGAGEQLTVTRDGRVLLNDQELAP